MESGGRRSLRITIALAILAAQPNATHRTDDLLS
jgi:hypothetical protein